MERLQQYVVWAEQLLAKRPRRTFALTMLAAVALVVSRRPELLVHAQFWAEDGAIWYTDAYHKGFFAPLFQTYAGYFAVVHRLVAGISLLLPFHLVPLFFNVVGMAFLLLPVALINSSRLRHIIRSRLIALGISILYIGMPNNAEVFGNLTNIQWHLGVAAFLVLIASRATTRWWRGFDKTLLVATGLSSPLIIILLPVAALMWWRTRSRSEERDRLYNLGIMGALAIVQLLAIFVFSHYERVSGNMSMDFLNFTKIMVGQIFMGGTVGVAYVNYYYNDHFALYLLLVACLIVIIYATVVGPLWLKLFNLYWPLLLLSMFNSLAPTPGFNIWEGLANPTGGQRYWYIPIMGWLATLLWLALRGTNRLFQGAAVCALVLTVFVGLGKNWSIMPLTNLNFQHYAHAFEQTPVGTRYVVPINPGWHMILYKH